MPTLDEIDKEILRLTDQRIDQVNQAETERMAAEHAEALKRGAEMSDLIHVINQVEHGQVQRLMRLFALCRASGTTIPGLFPEGSFGMPAPSPDAPQRVHEGWQRHDADVLAKTRARISREITDVHVGPNIEITLEG